MSGLHVIFGAGPVGLAVMDELLSKGRQVRVVNRSGMKNAPQGVETMQGDATNPTFTQKACEGAEVVYFALNAPYDRWPEMFPPLQAGVLAGAKSAGARLVAMENLYGYGRPNGKPLTETTPYRADYAKGIARVKMSQALMDAHERGDVQVAIGRASDFFGPRVLVSMMGERVFYPALEGKTVQLLGNLDLPHTQTYMPDIGKALVILGERDEAVGEVWHIPSPPTITQREFAERVFKAAGQPPKVQAAPKIILRLMGLFNPTIRELFHTYYQFEDVFVMDHSKFAAAFGDISTPLDDAIQTTLDWYRANPR